MKAKGQMRVNMVNVIVKFRWIPRQRTGVGRAEFKSSREKVMDMLKELVEFSKISDIILTEKGEVRPYDRVLVNG